MNIPITGPCRLLKLFETTYARNESYLMCSVETDDNQIDTVRLYFWSLDFSKADLEFYQYREVVRRSNVFNDPIRVFKQVIIK